MGATAGLDPERPFAGKGLTSLLSAAFERLAGS